MIRYCCDKFKSQAIAKREEGLNIRIIKFDKTDLIDKNSQFRFFITPGYKLSDRAVPILNIAHCPFCGINLFTFYNDDAYINEDDNDFLYP